jgi:hypothetical protein
MVTEGEQIAEALSLDVDTMLKDTETMLEAVNVVDTEKLSEWESKFLENTYDRFFSVGRPLSVGQYNSLLRLYRKFY